MIRMLHTFSKLHPSPAPLYNWKHHQIRTYSSEDQPCQHKFKAEVRTHIWIKNIISWTKTNTRSNCRVWNKTNIRMKIYSKSTTRSWVMHEMLNAISTQDEAVGQTWKLRSTWPSALTWMTRNSGICNQNSKAAFYYTQT